MDEATEQAAPAAVMGSAPIASAPAPWRVRVSAAARRTRNPIRALVDGLQLQPNPDKPVIALSIGDPTLFGNFGPPPEAVAAVQHSLLSGERHGYAPCAGYADAREAVAQYASTPRAPVRPEDVVLCSGCSSALELSLSALLDPGDVLLAPAPGFPLYATLAESLGAQVRHYPLLAERGWQVEERSLEAAAAAARAEGLRVGALVLNNPSNPCGSVWPPAHLASLLGLARRLRLPVVTDEIYEHLVFPGEEFVPLADLSTDVPILTCGGLTKRWMVPGWRMGWIIIHDRKGIFGDEVRNGLLALAQRTIGSNTLVQGALPAILRATPPSFFHHTARTLQEHARLVHGLLCGVPGLRPVMPRGAMYMMVGLRLALFPFAADELAFVERLMAEESVFCLPGQCFGLSGYVRLVLTPPKDQLREACERIAAFCARHITPSDAMETMAPPMDTMVPPLDSVDKAAAADEESTLPVAQLSTLQV